MNEEQAYCACLRVGYFPEELPDGLLRERWRCDDCGTEFTKRPAVTENDKFWEDCIESDGINAGIDCRGLVGMAIVHTMVERIQELEGHHYALAEHGDFIDEAHSRLGFENTKLKEMLGSIRDLTENCLHAMTLSTPVRIRLEELNRTLKGVVTLANSVIPEGD